MAIVVYEAEPDKIREHAAKYFALREEGIKDMIHSVPLLMGPLWLEGLRRGTNQDWDKIRNALACFTGGHIHTGGALQPDTGHTEKQADSESVLGRNPIFTFPVSDR